MEASLRSRRARNFWESDLSVKEQMLWMTLNGGDRTWLPDRVPPPKSAQRITPVDVGDERVIAVLSPWSDSNLVIVTRRGENDYVAINDVAVERDNPARGRDRRENDSAPTLDDLYARVGPLIPAPPHRVNREFEPFLRHLLPVLP